jgi:YfiR/HmsC-like
MACWLGLTLLPARAQEAEVPIALQVELLARLLWYERELQKSAGKELVALVVARRGDPDSSHAAAQVIAQLDRVKELGGKVVKHTLVSYESADQLGRIVQQRRPYLIYWSKGMAGSTKELGRLPQEGSVLTVNAGRYAGTSGSVLGFELASSKPRIVLNLKQARAQKLDFSAQVLRVVRVLP